MLLNGQWAQDGQDFLVANQLTEADVRPFVTLVRFDLAYHGPCKINLRQVRDYPNISQYVQGIHEIPGSVATVYPDHIKAGYYSIKALNPSGTTPAGPALA